MKKVELWMLHGAYRAAIIPCQSGVTWSNQTGGHACDHPEVEGILVPLPWMPDYRSLESVDNMHDEPYDREAVATFLTDAGLDALFEPLSDPGPDDRLSEAWIPVQVIAKGELLGAFHGQRAIITYENSD